MCHFETISYGEAKMFGFFSHFRATHIQVLKMWETASEGDEYEILIWQTK